MALIEAARFPNGIEAEIAHGRLVTEGIMVDEEDLDRARAMLDRFDTLPPHA